ncbi:MAG: nucleoside deaminase [Acidobacteriia bacterium]|nr:nucleoside deaminase [Terriglobia bacterium]
MSDKDELIRKTIELAVESVNAGGGPFSAIVVKDGKTIAFGTNQVTATLDPTAHAEVVAIRRACLALGDFELTGCEIYCSCEPCPMCLGAIYWARPTRVYFAATGQDAAQAGFDDTFIKEQIVLPYEKQKIPVEHLQHENAQAPFIAWKAKADKVEY